MSKWRVHVDNLEHASAMGWVQQLRHHPYFSFLDSSDLGHSDARFSYVAFDPMTVLEWKNGRFVLRDTKTDECDYFDRFQNAFDAISHLYSEWEPLELAPFTGGILALLSYEMYRYLDSMPTQLKEGRLTDFPMCFMGLYQRVIVVDHHENSAYFVQRFLTEEPESLDMFCMHNELEDFQLKDGLRSHISQAQYQDTVQCVQEHIRQGDIYQLNFTYPSSAFFSGDLMVVYDQLRKVSPVPYGAYFDLGDFQVLSASPELFFSVEDREIMTRPIKGTIERGTDSDDRLKADLMRSEKDRAELMMIVDLERNDLGRICELGSVDVPVLAEVETFRYLHHMVSTVKGTLRSGVDGVAIFEALFPGGSITGAPKYRAMELIHCFETEPRGIYTGAMGYFAAGGAMKFNIPIRTMVAKHDRLYSCVGSGLVADSIAENEWQETICKGRGVQEAVRNRCDSFPADVRT